MVERANRAIANQAAADKRLARTYGPDHPGISNKGRAAADMAKTTRVHTAAFSELDSIDRAAKQFPIRVVAQVEAHGVKGMDNKSWRKTFKDRAALDKWAESNDAEIQGTRESDAAERINRSKRNQNDALGGDKPVVPNTAGGGAAGLFHPGQAQAQADHEARQEMIARTNAKHAATRALAGSAPDLAHLASENKIPAKIADVPAGGKGSFSEPLSLTPDEVREAKKYGIDPARVLAMKEKLESGDAPGTVRKSINDLQPGDVVTGGMHGGREGKGVVARVDQARAKGFKVVTFEGGGRSSGHGSSSVATQKRDPKGVPTGGRWTK
jgi:hypothetical protein